MLTLILSRSRCFDVRTVQSEPDRKFQVLCESEAELRTHARAVQSGSARLCMQRASGIFKVTPRNETKRYPETPDPETVRYLPGRACGQRKILSTTIGMLEEG